MSCGRLWNTRSCTLKIRGGCDVDSHGKKAGKGALIQWEKSGTIGASQDQTLFVWYTLCKGGVRPHSNHRAWDGGGT